jgi:hypothetical protein
MGLPELAGLPQLRELDLRGSAGVSNQALGNFQPGQVMSRRVERTHHRY